MSPTRKVGDTIQGRGISNPRATCKYMRQLTIQQKKVLDGVMRRDPEVSCWDELDIDTVIALEKINNTEILHHEVNRYMHDQVMKRIYA